MAVKWPNDFTAPSVPPTRYRVTRTNPLADGSPAGIRLPARLPPSLRRVRHCPQDYVIIAISYFAASRAICPQGGGQVKGSEDTLYPGIPSKWTIRRVVARGQLSRYRSSQI